MGTSWSAPSSAPSASAAAVEATVAELALAPLSPSARTCFGGRGAPVLGAVALAVGDAEALCRRRAPQEAAGHGGATAATEADSVAALAQLPALAEQRKRLVPGRVVEAAFWANFWEAAACAVLRLYLADRNCAAHTRDALEALAWDERLLRP